MLCRAEFELFVWEEDDLMDSDLQMKVIGAPLEVAQNLYLDIQNTYKHWLAKIVQLFIYDGDKILEWVLGKLWVSFSPSYQHTIFLSWKNYTVKSRRSLLQI